MAKRILDWFFNVIFYLKSAVSFHELLPNSESAFLAIFQYSIRTMIQSFSSYHCLIGLLSLAEKKNPGQCSFLTYFKAVADFLEVFYAENGR
jgi:hypothetical protein